MELYFNTTAIRAPCMEIGVAGGFCSSRKNKKLKCRNQFVYLFEIWLHKSSALFYRLRLAAILNYNKAK